MTDKERILLLKAELHRCKDQFQTYGDLHKIKAKSIGISEEKAMDTLRKANHNYQMAAAICSTIDLVEED